MSQITLGGTDLFLVTFKKVGGQGEGLGWGVRWKELEKSGVGGSSGGDGGKCLVKLESLHVDLPPTRILINDREE